MGIGNPSCIQNSESRKNNLASGGSSTDKNETAKIIRESKALLGLDPSRSYLGIEENQDSEPIYSAERAPTPARVQENSAPARQLNQSDKRIDAIEGQISEIKEGLKKSDQKFDQILNLLQGKNNG